MPASPTDPRSSPGKSVFLRVTRGRGPGKRNRVVASRPAAPPASARQPVARCARGRVRLPRPARRPSPGSAPPPPAETSRGGGGGDRRCAPAPASPGRTPTLGNSGGPEARLLHLAAGFPTGLFQAPSLLGLLGKNVAVELKDLRLVASRLAVMAEQRGIECATPGETPGKCRNPAEPCELHRNVHTPPTSATGHRTVSCVHPCLMLQLASDFREPAFHHFTVIH